MKNGLLRARYPNRDIILFNEGMQIKHKDKNKRIISSGLTSEGLYMVDCFGESKWRWEETRIIFI